jgi:hypothetical protein
MKPISPKVHSAAVSGGFGGYGAAILAIWIMQDWFGMAEQAFTPERVAALTGLFAVVGSYTGGWLKSA